MISVEMKLKLTSKMRTFYSVCNENESKCAKESNMFVNASKFLSISYAAHSAGTQMITSKRKLVPEQSIFPRCLSSIMRGCLAAVAFAIVIGKTENAI